MDISDGPHLDEGTPTVVEAVEPEPLPPLRLREPLAPVIAHADAFEDFCRALAGGHGPVAIDAERASGYRYSQRAYLIQLRRAGVGTALIDPTGLPRKADTGLDPSRAPADLDALNAAIGGAEWILHAATQDLPCLAEVGMRPTRLFDTELAGRLLGRERVSLAALVASELGLHLAKGHGSADWSERPLSPAQVQYAALDVEPLSELRNLLHAELAARGRWEWAEQEFAALTTFEPKERSAEPWRRTSGMHRLRKPRQLAVVRALWHARDELAERTDIAPGRVLPDAAIIAAAQAMPTSIEGLVALPEFAGRGQRRRSAQWLDAITRTRDLSDADCPDVHPPSDGPPPPRQWADRNPAAAQRLTRSRAAIDSLAERLGLAAELVVSPGTIRALCWDPPQAGPITDALAERGARPWQVEMIAPLVAPILTGNGAAG